MVRQVQLHMDNQDPDSDKPAPHKLLEDQVLHMDNQVQQLNSQAAVYQEESQVESLMDNQVHNFQAAAFQVEFHMDNQVHNFQGVEFQVELVDQDIHLDILDNMELVEQD